MAGVKISALPAILASQLTDIFPIVQGGVTAKANLQQVLDLFDPNIQLSSPSQVSGLGQAALKSVSDNAQPSVASVFGGTVVGNVAIFRDAFGTVEDSGVAETQLALLGGAAFSGTVSLNGTQSANNDAATIGYVNSVASGLTIKGACFAGTTANLNATYDNGVAGVGATLTNAGALAAFSTDGQSPALNSRILVKNQTAQEENGIYVLSTVGDGATPWVLTRASDYDTAAEINPGDLVIIQNGTTLELTSWLQTADPTVIGTDPIEFTQFSVAPGSLGQAAFKSVTDNTKASVASVNGVFTAGHIIVAADTAGTIEDGGATSQFLLAANDLSDLADVPTALINLGLGTPTGTGNVVLNNTPDITTPNVTGGFNDVNGNLIFQFLPVASAVNWLQIANNSIGGNVSIGAAGTDANIAININSKGTSGINLKGVTDGSNAPSGYVGEFISSTVLFASAVGIASGVPANVTSISLPAGDWDVWGNIGFSLVTATSMSNITAATNTVSATLPNPAFYINLTITGTSLAGGSQNAPKLRYNLTSTTTIYLVGQATLAGGTGKAYGGIYARLRR